MDVGYYAILALVIFGAIFLVKWAFGLCGRAARAVLDIPVGGTSIKPGTLGDVGVKAAAWSVALTKKGVGWAKGQVEERTARPVVRVDTAVAFREYLARYSKKENQPN